MANVESVLRNSAVALQDINGHIRWPLTELYAYLTDGLLELQGILLVVRPDEFLESRVHDLEPGPAQVIPGVRAVKRIWANVDRTDNSVYGMAVQQRTSTEVSDFNPLWPGSAATKEVVNCALDPMHEQRFWVYPPSDGTGSVRVDVVLEPEGITGAPTNAGEALTDYAIDLPVRDIFAPSLTYYVLHRAWAKDADFAGNTTLADRYYNLFKEAVRVQAGVEQRAAAREQNL